MKKFAILILALICVNAVMAQPRALSGPPRPTLLNSNDTQGNQILEIQIQTEHQ